LNGKIAMLEGAELGLFALALWIPYRMARAGVRTFWSVLAGWLALGGLVLALALLSVIGNNNVDSDLVNAMPDGQTALGFLLFGWGFAAISAAVGRIRKGKSKS
jgi:hypothetical protein